MSTNRLYLLDAFALIYRAYYAMQNAHLYSQEGFNTGAVMGFVNTLETVLNRTDVTHIAVCFDPQGPTFRHEADASYKAERQEMPEDIAQSIPVIKEILEAYRIPVVEVPGYEADDVIGTLAKRGAEAGFTVYMLTPDKDFGQLVGPQILQDKPSYRGKDSELRGEKEVCERYGISSTAQVIDLLALMGDKIDNIPGCPGVGEKTAVKLIQQFGSVENLLEHTDELKGALRRKVEENAELIRHSKFMATICTDVPADIDFSSLQRRDPDTDRLFAIFSRLRFTRLKTAVAKRLTREHGGTNPVAKTASKTDSVGAPSLFGDFDFGEESGEEKRGKSGEKESGKSGEVGEEQAPVENTLFEAEWELVDDAAKARRLDELCAKADSAGIFLKAFGEGDMEAHFRGAAVALPGGENFVIPASCAEGIAVLLDTMARADVLKVSPQAKRDYVLAHRLRGDDAPALANYYDVALAHYLLQPEFRHTTEVLADTYLHLTPAAAPADPKESRMAAALREPLSMDEQRRLCHEARLALMLYVPVRQEIEKEGMTRLLEEMELPLARVLAEMEITGVRIDTDALQRAADDMEQRIADITAQIYTLAGQEFNVGSPSEVGRVLFDDLHLDPKAKKTKNGQYSTTDAILESLTPLHPIVDLIRTFRRLRKLVSTWLTALPKAINPATGRVHTNYNQTVTATGRISSSNPNLQNIPVRQELGREIRRAFIADPGCIFLSADYSQIELRLVADFANDPVMLDAFNRGDDIHAITASKIYNVPLDEVSADQRRHAKTANFGILYGISAFGLSQRLGLSRADAKMLIDGYNATFPTVHAYMQQTLETARQQGFVTTYSGRRRMQPDINSHNATVRGYAERNAINAPIQGSAADVIKTAMVNIFAEMERRGLRSRMIMQVHDELNFNVAPGEEEIMKQLVPQLMADAYHGKVRLEAECGTGPDWLTAH